MYRNRRATVFIQAVRYLDPIDFRTPDSTNDTLTDFTFKVKVKGSNARWYWEMDTAIS